MGGVIGGGILPRQTGKSLDSAAPAIVAVFWGFGPLLAAFGVGNLIGWLLIDRKGANNPKGTIQDSGNFSAKGEPPAH